MKKLLLSVLYCNLALGYFSGPTLAQSAAALIEDQSPINCKKVENSTVTASCDNFVLYGIWQEKGSQADILRAEFSTGSEKLIFLLDGEPSKIKEDTSVGTLNFHPIRKVISEQSGTRVDQKDWIGHFCSMTPDYSKVLCLRPDILLLYVNTNHQSRQPGNINQQELNRVFTTNSYTNTGLSLNAGDEVKIAANGTIHFGLFTGSGGPRGIQFNPNYNYFVDLPHGQLVGRIHRPGMQEFDGWFPIGEEREFIVNSPGILELVVNDNKAWDNSGGFNVEVSVISRN